MAAVGQVMDKAEPPCRPYTKYQRQRDRNAALVQQVQLLHDKLLQLSLENTLLQLRGQVLEQLCACKLGLLYVLQKHGPRLEGPLDPGLFSSTSTGLGHLEGHVRGLLESMGSSSQLPQQLPPPSFQVTSLSDNLSACVMDGGCMSLVGSLVGTLPQQHSPPHREIQLGGWRKRTGGLCQPAPGSSRPVANGHVLCQRQQ